jgi:hypothetical protein
MKYNLILMTYCLLLMTQVTAQTYGLQVLGGTKMVIQAGTVTVGNNLGTKIDGANSSLNNNATLVMGGSFLNQNNATVQGGTYKVGGSFTNTSTFLATGTTLEVNGNDACIINTTSPLNNLTINKGATNPIINQGSALLINGILNFSRDNSFVQTNAFNLSIASTGTITGFDNNNFIITNGMAALEQTVEGTPKTFPVGTTSTSYTPLSITQAGASIRLNVRAIEQVSSNPNTNGVALTANFVNKTWQVGEPNTPITKNLTLTPQWNGTNELTSFNPNQCGVVQWNSVASVWYAPLAMVGARSGSDPYTRTRSGITDIGLFAVSSGSAILPLTLLDFTAQSDNNAAFLAWQTTNERNTAYFDIEKSLNAKKWSTIGVQKAGQVGGGYKYTDMQAFERQNTAFYRLKMIDVDGSFSYSPIRQVITSKTNNLILYPNPVKTELTVTLSEANTEWQLIDALGKVRASFKGGQTLDLTHYTEGVYFIRTEKGRVSQFVIIH